MNNILTLEDLETDIMKKIYFTFYFIIFFHILHFLFSYLSFVL